MILLSLGYSEDSWEEGILESRKEEEEEEEKENEGKGGGAIKVLA